MQRRALREEETGEKRCKSICLQNSFNCCCPLFQHPLIQSKGKEEETAKRTCSAADVWQQEESETKGGNEWSREREREINQFYSVPLRLCSHNSLLFCKLWNTKIKTNPAQQHAEDFHWSKVTNNCLSSFISTDALKQISTMILHAGNGFWRQTLRTLYITICYFQKNYSETWLIVKENLFQEGFLQKGKSSKKCN